MKTKLYTDLIEKQRQELSDFPIAYAFDEKQLEEALKKIRSKERRMCNRIWPW